MSEDELEQRAREWLAHDPDPETASELRRILDAGDHRALVDRFGRSLEFGTAGLRGAMGAGPNRMNRLVVRRTTVGLIRHLGPGARVVVGHDARKNSAAFAADAAAVIDALGGEAIVLPPMVPTPVVAFAVRKLEADAGIVCTASHNPRDDNGYKLYLDDGAQVIPPVDALVAAAISSVGPDDIPPVGDPPAPSRAGEDVLDAYVTHAAGLVAPGGPRRLSLVYTPLHGVGTDLTQRVFAAAGFDPLAVVAAQARPDPAFPTVTRPNPEEPEALALAAADLLDQDADLALVHDPDADRLGVLAPGEGGWAALTGNQIGALLADHVLRRSQGDDRLVVDTVVSSRLLGWLAREHGVHHMRTLTGFKWIVRPAMQHPEWRFVFGYEEALGYSVDGYVRDKDGITAALVFAELAAALKEDGSTVWDRLRDIYRRHGMAVTRTWSLGFESDADRVRATVMARLLDDPPTSLGGLRLLDVVDHRIAGDHPPTDLLEMRVERDVRVSVRPSGTEPRLKVYAEVVVDAPTGDAAREAAAEDAAVALLERVREDLFELLRRLVDTRC